jgi:hypothetical protein
VCGSTASQLSTVTVTSRGNAIPGGDAACDEVTNPFYLHRPISFFLNGDTEALHCKWYTFNSSVRMPVSIIGGLFNFYFAWSVFKKYATTLYLVRALFSHMASYCAIGVMCHTRFCFVTAAPFTLVMLVALVQSIIFTFLQMVGSFVIMIYDSISVRSSHDWCNKDKLAGVTWPVGKPAPTIVCNLMPYVITCVLDAVGIIVAVRGLFSFFSSVV